MKNLVSFLDFLVQNKLVKEAVIAQNKGYVLSNSGDSYPFALGDKGFIVAGKCNKSCFCPNPEAGLMRVLSSALFGTTDHKFRDTLYSSVTMYPKAIQSSGVLFETADGQQFLASSSNTLVTLGLYDILYSKNAEHSILMLPELLPSGSESVAIASSKLDSLTVSPKNEFLSKELGIDFGTIISSKEVPNFERVNRFLGDHSVLSSKAPAADKVCMETSQLVVQANDQGYDVLAQEEVNGFNYILSGQIKPGLSLVREAVREIHSSIDLLKDGVDFSGLNSSVKSSLTSGVQPKAIFGTLILNSTVQKADEASSYWGIPVTSSVKVMTWRF